jgi:hypothetical protein
MEKNIAEVNASTWIRDHGVEFSFPRLSQLSKSGCTTKEFLAYSSQRILLKHCFNFFADIAQKKNFLCQSSQVLENLPRMGLNKTQEKKLVLEAIIKKEAGEDVPLDDMKKQAKEFCDWFETEWFESLRSDRTSMFLTNVFGSSDVEYSDKKLDSGVKEDWKKLAFLFGLADRSELNSKLEDRGIDTACLTNNSSDFDKDLTKDALEGVLSFCRRASKNVPSTSLFTELGDISSQISGAYYTTTIQNIERIASGKKTAEAPYESYSLFKDFDSTFMESLMKLNAMTFSTYSMFKKLSS